MFKIDASIHITYPGTKMGILVMKDVSYFGLYTETQTAQDLDELRGQYAHLDRTGLKTNFPVKAYVDYYKRFGHSYHLLAQLESVLKGKKTLDNESALLQAMFFSELDGMLLTAGHDFAKLELPLELKIATGTELYQSISSREVTAINGDIALCDGNGIISSILRGPDCKSRITPSTTEVLFSIYAPPGIDDDYIVKHLGKLEKIIRGFAPLSRTELLHVFSNN